MVKEAQQKEETLVNLELTIEAALQTVPYSNNF
jgi:hypothetical protein